nr:MAG TPA: hypothetical protein [Caudoviricetes sp.]
MGNVGLYAHTFTGRGSTSQKAFRGLWCSAYWQTNSVTTLTKTQRLLLAQAAASLSRAMWR